MPTQAMTALQAQQQNAQMRAAYIASSQFLRINQTNSTSLSSNASNYQMPLQSLGLLTSVDLEFNMTITNTGTTDATLQPGAPYTFLQQISFVDQGSLTRSQISGLALFTLLNATTNRQFPWGGEGVQNNGMIIGDFNYPVLPTTVPAGGTVNLQFRIKMPVARSDLDTTGAVLLQTSQNSTAANIKFTLAPLMGSPDSPYGVGASTLKLSMTAGTVSMRQNYWQPFGNAVVPPLDIATVNYLWETSNDTTNLVNGMVKEIPLQIQYPTDLIGLTYYNGSAYTFGSDISTMEEWIGNTRITNSSTTQRNMDYRLSNGFDPLPGQYLFDYRTRPLTNQQLGTFTIRFQPSVATLGSAYVRTVYRQSRPVGGVTPALLQAV